MPSRSLTSWAHVGRRVAAARKAADLSQEELAGRLRLDRTAVSKIESGHRRVDTLEFTRLARELGRSIGWFVTDPPVAIVSRRGVAAAPKSRRVDALLEELAQDVELSSQGAAPHRGRRRRRGGRPRVQGRPSHRPRPASRHPGACRTFRAVRLLTEPGVRFRRRLAGAPTRGRCADQR